MPKRLTNEEKKRQTVERLLDSSEIVFSNKGFYGASVEEIAEEAGYSKGAVYANFKSKEDLFLALYDRRFNQQLADWGKVFEHKLDDAGRADKVEEVLLSHAKFNEDTQWTMLMLEFTLYALRNEDAKGKLASRYTQILDSMKESIQTHFGNHKVSSEQIEEIVISLLSLETGLNMLESIIPDLVSEGYRSRTYRKFL